jgi:hypothetical protein
MMATLPKTITGALCLSQHNPLLGLSCAFPLSRKEVLSAK